MSVLIETSLGEIVIDLYIEDCPIATKNFLKLCKLKYYNNVLFFNVQENFMVQTGDPTGTGNGGTSVYGLMYGEQAECFEDEIKPHLKHTKKGLVGMANTGANTNRSQFYITTRGEDLEYLDGKYTVFGEVAEGMDVLDQINQLFVDENGRPYQDVRIRHTYILDDPFPDPNLLTIPPKSPERDRPVEETVAPRLNAKEISGEENDGRTEEEIQKSLREKEAKSRAVVLEMIGDLPDADMKPPEEVLFVCKLNPVTESSDLDMAFCRFGPCKSEVIRDFKTGDSLCYAFVEFKEKAHCEEAYFKMNNVLLDDRRIKVDFSQSVSKLWNKFRRKEKVTAVDAPTDSRGKNNSRADGYGEAKGHGQRHKGRGNGGGYGALGGKNNDFKLKHTARRQDPDEYDLVYDDDDDDGTKHVSKSKDRKEKRSRSRSKRRDRDRKEHKDHKDRRDRSRSPKHGRRRNSRSRSRDRNRDRNRDRRDKRHSRSRNRDRKDRKERR
jgi:peptidyl-prolyl cis-trans isomerase-like 4